MKKYAIIVAAGAGTRMGNHIPKQFLELAGKPLLLYPIRAFTDAFPEIRIILVVPQDHLSKAQEIAASASNPSSITLIKGADTRFSSVRAGLQHVEPDSIVFVHDGVRCLLTPALVHRCYEVAMEKGNAIPAIAAVDSVRIEKNGVYESVDRSTIKLVQTPQTFRGDLIIPAYREAKGENFTDDAIVVENSGVRIHLVEGETTNFKVTRPADLLLAEMILKQRGITF